jgi:hypothetical protein
MAQAFYATISNAGYEQFPNLVVVHVLPGFSPGSPPPRPTPGPYPDQGLPGLPAYPDQGLPGLPPRPDQGLPMPPLGIWGPPDPRPDHPIVLPPDTPIPPSWIGTLPGPGEPGSPGNPYPPGSVPDHPSTGLNTFYMVIPYVGVVGPFTMPPGVDRTPPVIEAPPAVPDQAP